MGGERKRVTCATAASLTAGQAAFTFEAISLRRTVKVEPYGDGVGSSVAEGRVLSAKAFIVSAA